ncbi:MAG TPA: methyltransferase domain-containing protein [Longimicrobiaceae bacterium]
MSSSLSSRYPLRRHRFEHGDFRVELVGPESPEALIDESAFNVDERLPYWAELWPSARALAEELLDRPTPRGPVLELGCGLALPSLTLAWRGVQVVASDYYPEALEFATENARRNQLPPPETLLLDWRDPPPDLPQFDLVIAADVLYEARNIEMIINLLPRVLSPAGSFLLADPGRAHFPRFRKRLGPAGWTIGAEATRFVPGPTERPMQIHLLTIRRG